MFNFLTWPILSERHCYVIIWGRAGSQIRGTVLENSSLICNRADNPYSGRSSNVTDKIACTCRTFRRFVSGGRSAESMFRALGECRLTTILRHGEQLISDSRPVDCFREALWEHQPSEFSW